ncbi:RagB/SusD family nutrient uptake outer membrane protein [Pedobacter psychrophilus]|nr:RagB/SusD family nutrient uptake outer membrane protein [Pedobacter psychrophilus]
MNIKKLTHKIAFAIVLIAFTSCKKDITQFLETPPGVSLDEDKVFSSQQEIELYISTGYALSIPTFMGYRDGVPTGSNFFTASATSPSGVLPRQAQTIFSGATDEAESTADFVPTQQFNTGSVLPQNIINFEDHWYFARFRGLRVANILLERIDAAPVPDTYKIQVKAEAKFLRAMNNFEMFKRYGGFQIVDKRITAQESNAIPRSSVADCVNFIVKDLDEAFAELPVGFPVAAQKGRVSKAAIAALKSRTLLYAASPLFNTATPYISFANNNLICYGNPDINRWKLAVDATLIALNTAFSEGYELLDVPAKRSPVPVNGRTVSINGTSTVVGGQVLGNYREAWEQPDNNEIILAFKGYAASGRFSFPWQHVLPNLQAQFDGFTSGTAVNHRFIKRYQTKRGVDQTWLPIGQVGNDLTQKYSDLDSRFAQSIGYNGSRYSQNQTRLELYQGGIHLANCRTGTWMKKLVPDQLYAGNVIPVISVFRYNELLLNLAEALNEFSGPGTSLAPSLTAVTATPATLANYINNFQYPTIPISPYDIINKIRLRSGMPPLKANLDRDTFREALQNERAIELAFENYRFWDVRRWLIADKDILNGGITRLIIRPINIALDQFSYEEQIVEPRTFQRRLYLHPYDFNEIQRNPNIIQNPGW